MVESVFSVVNIENEKVKREERKRMTQEKLNRKKLCLSESRRWLKEIETVSQKGCGTPVLQNIKYSFDGVGNVSGYTNTAGSYTTAQQYEYDSLYQLTNVKGQTENRQFGLVDYTASYEQTYSFDNAGLGNMMTKNSSSVQSDSRLLGDDLNYKLDYEYATGYAHRVNRIGTRYYQYDGNGNLTAEQEGAFSSGTGNGGTPTSGGYTITDLGDDVSVIDQGWGMVDTPSNGGGGTPGDPITRGYRRDYQWNERNLLKVSSDNRYTVQYTYGADGERTGKYSTSATGGSPAETLYFNKMWSWRHDGLLSDRTGRNSKHIYVGETRLVTKIGRADGSFTNEEKLKQYWYHSDHLGSAQLISNVDGEEYERIEYTPYGELWIEKASAASNIDIPYRFTGKERDSETSLYYFGARYLDARVSRWLSSDPALGEYIPGAPINDEVKKKNGELPGMGGVFNTVNLHLYHYSANNPVKYVDVDGREYKDNISIAFLRFRTPEQALGKPNKTGDTVASVSIDGQASTYVFGFQGSATRLTQRQDGGTQNDSIKHESKVKLQLQTSTRTGGLSLRILDGITIDGRGSNNGIPEGSKDPNTVHGNSANGSERSFSGGILVSEGCIVGTPEAMAELFGMMEEAGVKVGDTFDAYIADAEKLGS
jgi:RHS repeat-associated protein